MALYNKVNKEELKEQLQESTEERTTLSFYRYHQIEDVPLFRNELYRLLEPLSVFGRIYVAKEGINGQISLPSENITAFRTALETYPFLKDLRLNVAIDDDGKSFYLLKIKVRDKIVADGIDNPLDLSKGGEHIDAERFNELVKKENTVVIDMRNHYESEVGHFDQAICPDVETFRHSLPIVEDILEEHRGKDVVMYCTGGIRCEKATAYFRQKGFENLYQLDGGIIEYARQVRERNLPNHFIGKNFVFDERLGERISEDVIARCHQCGSPCDAHRNCANDACHLLFIQCQKCEQQFSGCCSSKCKEFILLPNEEQIELRKKIQFNGSKFGKGRYKANKAGDTLDIS